MVRPPFRLSIGCLLGLFVAAGALAQKPAEPDVDRTLRELLNEVRLLRQVLQATSVGSVRAQILLTQRQLHNERTVQIERQLAALRTEEADVQNQISALEDRSSDLEKASPTETDSGKRAAYESELQQLSRARDRAKDHIDQAKVRENELNVTLSREQAEVDRVQRDLDGIEKDLDELQSLGPKKP